MTYNVIKYANMGIKRTASIRQIDYKKEKLIRGKRLNKKDKKLIHTYIHIYIAPMVNSWRSESSNINFVVLDKLLFDFPKR